MSKFEVTEAVMPACWASALINGDYTSFYDDDGKAEIAALEAELARYSRDGWIVSDVKRDKDGDAEDPRFTWSYALYGGTARGGDVITYILHRQRHFWHVTRVRLDKGGYSDGVYYGVGEPVYRAYPQDPKHADQMEFRAANHAAAQTHVKAVHPTARFFHSVRRKNSVKT